MERMGKRNMHLNKKVVEFAKEIAKEKNKTAQLITKDAIRKLTSEKIQKKR